MTRKLFIGVDIGGTFTDLVMAEQGTADVRSFKTLTTPENPVTGMMTVIKDALAAIGAHGKDIARLVHATTLATNIVLERQGARVGYVTTKGFGDMFDISKQKPLGADQFDILYRRPQPLVAREMIAEIPERMGPRGVPLRDLDEEGARQALFALAKRKPEGIAVCLLHSYANADHERRVGDLIREILPEAHVSLSSNVWPEYLEYERGSTTLLSAYIGPTIARYIGELERQLADLGVTAVLQIMQSSGGVMGARDAVQKSVFLIESGPAAGVIATADLGKRNGRPNLISFDMGGTTAKAGLVQQGEPRITHDFRVGSRVSSGGRESGEPIKVPVIDLAEVGAGGGSIAWADSGGLMQVGPRSAGASPGPACYGLGGTEPTVTDANLALGYLDPDYFLGGKMKIIPELSAQAIERLSKKIGIDPLATARGIYELANTHMGSAIRIVTLQRGIDPREYAITASGGAGPAHVVRIAEQFGITTAIVPPSPGVRSAFGLLVSDMVADYVANAFMPLLDADHEKLTKVFDELEEKGRRELDQQLTGEVIFERLLGVRFASQAMDIPVKLKAGLVTAETLQQADADFRASYFETFGTTSDDPSISVSCRLRVIVVAPKIDVPRSPKGDGDIRRALKKTRIADFGKQWQATETPVFDRLKLAYGDRIAGPALIEEPDATTVCPHGWNIAVDEYLNLVIEKDRPAST